MSVHSLIQLFETRPQLLDIAGSAESLDEALVLLAGWMDQAPLSEDDVAVLAQVWVSSTAGVCAGRWTRRLPAEPVGFLAESLQELPGCRQVLHT